MRLICRCLRYHDDDDDDDDDNDDDDDTDGGFCAFFGGLNDSKMWTRRLGKVDLVT